MRLVKLILTGAVVLVFAIAIALFLFTYSVRFTEYAVVTRFGKAAKVYDGDTDPGLHFKWFYPIDSVTKYDTRARLVQMRKEAQQTADNRQVIVEAFCTWRVADPQKFFERFSSEGERTDVHYDAASDAIKTRLRTAVGEIARYRIDELFEVNPNTGEQTKLAELENAILEALRASSEDGQTVEARTGIAVSSVGISSIVLPQETSKAVFDRMKQDRQTLANAITSQAASEAEAIKSAAQTDRDRIEAFTLVRAAEIRAEGDEEARASFAQMAEHEELAVFLEAIEFIRDFYARKATLVLETKGPFALFNPDVIAETPRGELPGVDGFPGLGREDRAARDDEDDAEGDLEEVGTQAGGGE